MPSYPSPSDFCVYVCLCVPECSQAHGHEHVCGGLLTALGVIPQEPSTVCVEYHVSGCTLLSITRGQTLVSGCLPLSLSNLLFQTGSLTEPGSRSFS